MSSPKEPRSTTSIVEPTTAEQQQLDTTFGNATFNSTLNLNKSLTATRRSTRVVLSDVTIRSMTPMQIFSPGNLFAVVSSGMEVAVFFDPKKFYSSSTSSENQKQQELIPRSINTPSSAASTEASSSTTSTPKKKVTGFKKLFSHREHTRTITGLCLSPDSKFLVSSGEREHNGVIVRNPDDGKAIGYLEGSGTVGGKYFCGMSFSKNSKKFAVANDRHEIIVYNVYDENENENEDDDFSDKENCATTNTTSKSKSNNSENDSAWKKERTLSGVHTDLIDAIDFSPIIVKDDFNFNKRRNKKNKIIETYQLVSAGNDRKAVVFEFSVFSQRVVHVLDHDASLSGVKYSPDGSTIVTCMRTSPFHITTFDAISGQKLCFIEARFEGGDLAATSSVRYSKAGHSSSVYSINFFNDSRRIVSCSNDARIKIHDISSPPADQFKDEIRVFGTYAYDVSVSNDLSNEFFAVGCRDNKIRLFLSETLEPIAQVTHGNKKEHDNATVGVRAAARLDVVTRVVINQQNTRLYSGGGDNRVCVYEIATEDFIPNAVLKRNERLEQKEQEEKEKEEKRKQVEEEAAAAAASSSKKKKKHAQQQQQQESKNKKEQEVLSTQIPHPLAPEGMLPLSCFMSFHGGVTALCFGSSSSAPSSPSNKNENPKTENEKEDLSSLLEYYSTFVVTDTRGHEDVIPVKLPLDMQKKFEEFLMNENNNKKKKNNDKKDELDFDDEL